MTKIIDFLALSFLCVLFTASASVIAYWVGSAFGADRPLLAIGIIGACALFAFLGEIFAD
jgi:hypothetical protein